MKLKVFSLIVCLCCCISIGNTTSNISASIITMHDYLKKPTGHYGVGFEDFHWVNDLACPDFNFNGKNQGDFSAANINHCHEIMVRIYYPTKIKYYYPNNPYYLPFIEEKKQDIFEQIPSIDKKQIAQLNQLKSYATRNAMIEVDSKFPVLLFSPGFSYPAQAYENFIIELVSHGYIVVGINTPFINLVELPNGHVVAAAEVMTEDDLENKLVPLQAQDLLYTLEKLKKLHHSTLLFSRMDLNQVGVFGHSMGARVLADVVHAYPAYFKAAATLDIGFDESRKSLKKFTIPFMHAIAADRKLPPPDAEFPPLVFELGDKGYLVGFAPNEHNHDYSSHDNFSDLSTLQSLPAFQTLAAYRKHQFEDGFNLELKSQEPSKTEYKKFNKTTYALIKKAGNWSFIIYENGNKTKVIDVTMVAGLNEVLVTLPNKSPEQLTAAEIEPIKNVMASLHYVLFGKSFLGTGNGEKITEAINTYLIHFFNTFLKGDEDHTFKDCKIISRDTYIKCGPGQA